MDPKELEAFGKLADTAVDKLRVPLRAIAIVKMADEFYTKEDRRELTKEFSKLRVDAKIADDEHKRASKKVRAELDEDRKPSPSPEAVERDRLWSIASALYDRLARFRIEHPLIQEIVESRDALCARDHLNRLL